MASVSLLSTKFYIPRARPNAIPRSRLTEKLLAGVGYPSSIILLSGPAGFGKTTLLSELVAQLRQPVAWVSLDEGDSEPIRFWTYLIAAFQSVYEGVGATALSLFHSPQPLPDEAVATLLINDLARCEGEMALVLDDYHAIQTPSIHIAFSYLLDHLPDLLHIVVSTRVDPPWPLARFRVRNRLTEIRAHDLRFTTGEAAAFLNQVMGLNLASEEVAALEARTEGWIAGLQLAAISMQGRSDPAGFVKAFTGSHTYVAEYLVEEVIQRQPEEVQSFLLQTSILERLSAELCEAITGNQNCQAVLESLQRANLFVTPLDDEGRWFRYHHLFADLLQARLRNQLPSDEVAALHRRAGAWYEQSGMTPEAIEHALAAKDYSHALQLLEKIALPMILQANVRTVDRWLQAIPQAALENSPRMNMAFAWLNLLRGTFAQAGPYLQRLEAIFFAPQAGDLDPSIQAEWLAIQAKLLTLQGRPAESRDLALQALEILPTADATVRSMVLVNLATAYQQMLDYDRAAETYGITVQEAQAAGDEVTETLGISGRAQMVLQQGRLHLGFEIASEGIKRLEAGGRMTPFSATLYGELGQIYYYWHQLDRAQEYFQRSIQKSGQSGYSDPEIYYHVIRSRIFQMEGDWEASAQEMQKAGDLARAVPPAMIREEIVSQQVRVSLALDRPAAAQEALKAEGFSFDGAFRFPDLDPGSGERRTTGQISPSPVRPVTHPAGLLYNSALRVLLFQAKQSLDWANLTRGVELAALVLEGELQCRHLPVALETLLLRAQIYSALGDDQKGLADVARAVELAEPEGFISIFVEAGPLVASALATLLRRNLLGAGRSSFAREILAAFPSTVSPQAATVEESALGPRRAGDAIQGNESLPLVEPLTNRELEVLQLIAAGDSNRTIAEKLIITVSAVKKHTANIYGKLNVGSRTQAVARARRLGLLPADG